MGSCIGYVAVIISTALIVMFSEILPQAICSRHGLAIGAFFAIPVRILIYFWYILAWPIAKALDALLGIHHGVMYSSAGIEGRKRPVLEGSMIVLKMDKFSLFAL